MPRMLWILWVLATVLFWLGSARSMATAVLAGLLTLLPAAMLLVLQRRGRESARRTDRHRPRA